MVYVLTWHKMTFRKTLSMHKTCKDWQYNHLQRIQAEISAIMMKCLTLFPEPWLCANSLMAMGCKTNWLNGHQVSGGSALFGREGVFCSCWGLPAMKLDQGVSAPSVRRGGLLPPVHSQGRAVVSVHGCHRSTSGVHRALSTASSNTAPPSTWYECPVNLS